MHENDAVSSSFPHLILAVSQDEVLQDNHVFKYRRELLFSPVFVLVGS